MAAGNLRFAPGSGDFNADGSNNDYPNVTSYKQKHDRKVIKSETAYSHLSGWRTSMRPVRASARQEGNQTPYQFRNAAMPTRT